jgi:histidine decarboxylase
VTGHEVSSLLLEGLEARLAALQSAEEHKLGFPGWSSPLPEELIPFFSHELNNYGDPMVDPVFSWHAKDVERDVIRTLAELFSGGREGHWGYVTSGSSEAILYGLWLGRLLHPSAKVYYSRAAHPCVLKSACILDREAVEVPTDARGEMDYSALRERLRSGGPTSAIVLATIGTTLTEAVDDVRQIGRALAECGVRRYYIHADGALSAIPLAASSTLPPAFGIHSRGADSISISGHKFLGTPFPCGVLITRAAHRGLVPRLAGYTGSSEPTLTSSRSGHAALILWHRLRSLGLEGLRRRAEQTRACAEHAEHLLRGVGWEAWRSQPYACTVVLRAPPQRVLQRWPLPTLDGWAHLVCTPGVTRQRIERFVAELCAEATVLGAPRSRLDPPLNGRAPSASEAKGVESPPA